MKRSHQYPIIAGLFALLCLPAGCEGYLEVKPDDSLLVPSTLEDFQALLDNDRQMLNQDVDLTFIGADNYYIPYDSWQSLYTNKERNGYIWAKDIYEGERVADWYIPYEQAFIANLVLEGLMDIPVTAANRAEWERVKGSALFFRAYAFYNLLQVFAPPYDPATIEEAPGIPLRLSTDLEAPIYKAGLKECYSEVTTSLKEAAELLPEATSYKTRPSRAAAYGFLARVYLSLQDYMQAENYADKCLALHSHLIDYNGVDSTRAIPFIQYNEEVVFHSVLLADNIRDRAFVVPELYSSYAPGDLRKTLFFEENQSGDIEFTGRYSGNSLLFGGIAADEIYLIRAECRVRAGDRSGAMEDLNTLLRTRWEKGAFIPLTASDDEEALKTILQERRKELLFRGLRWTDLRRLNQDPAFATTLTRTLNGKTYSLPPGDPRYIYAIPEQETDLSGISNPR